VNLTKAEKLQQVIETKILISDCSCWQGGEAVTEGESMELIAAIPETLEPGLAPWPHRSLGLLQ